MPPKQDKSTNQSIEQVLDGVQELIELFEDLSKRVNSIELIIEGKYSQGIPSLYKDVQELKTATEKIRYSLEENFIRDLIIVKEVISNKEKQLAMDKMTMDTVLKDIESSLNNLTRQLENFEKDLTEVKDKTVLSEAFINKFRSIPSFITWLIPVLSLIVIIFINFIVPYILKWK